MKYGFHKEEKSKRQKIYTGTFCFTILVLAVIWLFHISYVDSLGKRIKESGIEIKSLTHFNPHIHMLIVSAIILLISALFAFLMSKRAGESVEEKAGEEVYLRRELITELFQDFQISFSVMETRLEAMQKVEGGALPEDIEALADETACLKKISDDIMDILQFQMGLWERNDTVFNLTESIQLVVDRYHKRMEPKGYTVTFQHEGNVFVVADEYKIYQVVYHLLDNAVKHTGEDKHIMLSQTRKNGKIHIAVTDSGSGIRAGEQSRVFEHYQREDRTHDRLAAGTGLGLVVAKKILQMHHSEYGVSSVAGKGSTFWFTLEPAPAELI